MKKIISFLLSLTFLLSGCSNVKRESNETGKSYQSKIQMKSEKIQGLFVEHLYDAKSLNCFVLPDGSMSSEGNYSIYKYTVSEGEIIRIEGTMIGNPNSASRIAFYGDEDGNDLVKAGWLNEGGWSDKYEIETTVPLGAKYLFVSSQNGELPCVKTVKQGKHCYLSADGNLIPEENYQIFSYAVRENETIEIKGSMKGNVNTAARYAFFGDEYGMKLIDIGSINEGGWNDEYDETIVAPRGTTTLFIGCQNGTEPTVMWESSDSYTTNPKLENKKIGVLGDSMAKGNGEFDGNCWPERIAARNNMKVDNQAINGKYLTQEIWKDSVIGGQVDALSDDCDIIIICAGTNDITAQIPLGDDDSTDTSTLCGTMNTLIPRLREKFPKAKIFCITPFIRYERLQDGSYSSVWKGQKEWINKLAELCEKWNVPCFNNSYQSDIEWNNDADRRFFSGTPEMRYGDDYHLNDVGLEYMSYLYENFISQNW